MTSFLARRGVISGFTIVVGTAFILGAVWLMTRSPDAAVADLPHGGAEPDAVAGTVSFTVPPGRSAADVGNDLEEQGIVRSSLQFRVLVSLMGLEQKLTSGEHELPAGASVTTIVTLLTTTKSVPVIGVTFPEGIRVEEMAVLAEEAGFGTKAEFIEAAATVPLPPDFANDIPADADRQGYLFPDTYIMPEGATAIDLVELMFETLEIRFDRTLRDGVRAQELTLHDALTLASIIEREAVLADERPIMAGVFFNRLDAGDRLGADPTVQFAAALDLESVRVHGYWKEELSQLDLEIDSDYNTRKFPGMPPGPITNPGRASIEAVAAPAETDLYYFVADAITADGSHLFAVTFEEHQRNIDRSGQ